MSIKRYLQIVLIVVLSLFHRSVIVILKSKKFDFKTISQQGLVTFHASGDFLWHVFEKVKKICIKLYFLKERFNKMEISMDPQNENQIKTFRKPPLSLSQEKLLAEKVKKYPCLFDKSEKNLQRKKCFSKIFLTQILRFFSRFDYLFFEVLKTKIASCQIL